ncbi:MAG: hypothetical protein K1X78_05850 [Verrucomicrobiaceae bacterium]|nr:hypothetical protein [Verrucomicrobiaceae bacterium]
MKNFVRGLIDKPTVAIFQWQWAGRIGAFFAYQHRRAMRRRLEERLRAEGAYGDSVIEGPFRGLKYPPLEQWASCRFEKINGTYEHELHPLLARLAAKPYTTVINVGAAEGFYTVGFARLFPQAKIVSYEAQPQHVEFCRRLAILNGVDGRIDFRGRCTAEELASLKPDGPALVWMDIDTGERPVLDPAKVPWLKNADILVELHDCLEAGLTDLIRGRFTGTHRIEQITNAGLDYARYPVLRKMTFPEIEALVGEDRRGLQDWFFMEPLAS